MQYMDIGCKVNCWECEREQCSLRTLMVFSIISSDVNIPLVTEEEFYSEIIGFLKPQAGLLITQGKDPKIVHQELMELAVSFYVARLKVIDFLNS